MITPVSSGAVRWLPAMMRTIAFAPVRPGRCPGRDLGLDHELVGARHDLHDGLAVADHAADGMDRELVDEAGLRRAQLDPLELVLGRRDALLELGDLALRLAQVLEHLGAEILVELDDLQLGLADLAARARDVGDELAALALEPRLVALQLREARDGDQILLVEVGDADELLADQLELGSPWPPAAPTGRGSPRSSARPARAIARAGRCARSVATRTASPRRPPPS